jgi:hypothetical protein
MASMFWDSEGVIHVDFLPHGVTVNAQYCCNLLHNDVHQAIQKKRPGKLSEIILLNDGADEGNIGLGNHEPFSLQP